MNIRKNRPPLGHGKPVRHYLDELSGVEIPRLSDILLALLCGPGTCAFVLAAICGAAWLVRRWF